MSIKHAVLGVLLHCPGHGYRIKKIFAPFVAKNGLNDGRLYPLLTQLEKQKLVRKETVRQQKSPNKNIYHITDEGREEFFRWLTSTDEEIDPVKYDFFQQYSFLMKCNFFDLLPKPERIAKLERQIEAAEEKITEYEHIREDMRKRGLNEYKIKILEFGLEVQKLKIQWARDLLDDELKTATTATTGLTQRRQGAKRTAGNIRNQQSSLRGSRRRGSNV